MNNLRSKLSDIITRIENDATSRLTSEELRRSDLSVFIRVIAGVSHSIYAVLDYYKNQLFSDSAETAYLERRASIFNLTRKTATKAMGEVKFNYYNDVVDVPVGTLLQSQSGVQYQLGVGNYSNVIQNWRNAGHAVLNLIHSDELSTTSSVTCTALGTSHGTAQGAVQGTAVDFRQTDINTQKSELAEAVKTSVRLTLLAQLAGIVSLVGTNLDGESDGDADTAGNTKSEDEILALRNEVLSVIEAEMIYQGTDDSNLYESLEELYSNVYHYFTNEVLADGKTITVTPKEPQPTLVLAYEQYGDTSRVDEIIRRNNIHFPLFMQKVPIRITKSVS